MAIRCSIIPGSSDIAAKIRPASGVGLAAGAGGLSGIAVNVSNQGRYEVGK
ncbi:hypothetical protein GCM10022222_09210 [Amycolatopsis ultiminotia]|uniref:Uncharacterized protein n=1 Tax=Amycolatopsis ultiminotia TaxID=543629 RepID=A0ABP6V467_9PSEU